MLNKKSKVEKQKPTKKFNLLHSYIEKGADLYPKNIVYKYVCGDGTKTSITYYDLNKKANQLANYLLSKGIKPNDRIALCNKPNIDFLIQIFAIWKIGAVCMCVDSNAPKKALIHQLRDSKSCVFLTTKALRNKHQEPIADTAIKTIEYDTITKEVEKCSGENPVLPISVNDQCLIFYTSGSTDKPKGIINKHIAFDNYAQGTLKTHKIKNTDRILIITNCTFDPIINEILLPTMVGGCGIIIDKKIARDPKLVRKIIDDEQITILQTTPSYLMLLLNGDWSPQKRLRVLCGGAPMTVELIKLAQQKNVELWNKYGTTETTGYNTEVCLEKWKEGDPIHIGSPMANNQIYVLDENGERVKDGQQGIVFIGGLGLARYLQEKLNSRFEKTKYGILYNTGDRVKVEQGKLIFRGRNDREVDIHGTRINLYAMECYLREHDLVKEVKTFVHNSGWAQYIVACVVIKNPQKLLNPQNILQKYTSEKYAAPINPHIMVFNQHDDQGLPRNKNGKIDAKLLREYYEKTVTADLDKIKSNVGETIEFVFKKVLKTNKNIKITDHFFNDLGGNSIQAAHAVSLLNKCYPKIKLTLLQFYRYPNISDLEGLINEPDNNEEPLKITISEKQIMFLLRQEISSDNIEVVPINVDWPDGTFKNLHSKKKLIFFVCNNGNTHYSLAIVKQNDNDQHVNECLYVDCIEWLRSNVGINFELGGMFEDFQKSVQEKFKIKHFYGANNEGQNDAWTCLYRLYFNAITVKNLIEQGDSFESIAKKAKAKPSLLCAIPDNATLVKLLRKIGNKLKDCDPSFANNLLNVKKTDFVKGKSFVYYDPKSADSERKRKLELESELEPDDDNFEMYYDTLNRLTPICCMPTLNVGFFNQQSPLPPEETTSQLEHASKM